MIKNVRYRKYSNKTLAKLQKDLRYLNRSENIIIKSDKNRNYYEISVEGHSRIMLNNITPLYRKCEQQEIENVNRETKN